METANSSGLPSEWEPWLGVDPIVRPDEVDWERFFNGDFEGQGVITDWLEGDGCLYELVQRDGDDVRRWFVLVLPVDGPTLNAEATLEFDEPPSTALDVSVEGRPATVAVVEPNADAGEVEVCVLPALRSGFAYPTGAHPVVAQAYADAMPGADAADPLLQRACAVATTPGMVASLLLFRGVQGHSALGSILMSAVRVPNLLRIMSTGGPKLVLHSDPSKAVAELFEMPNGAVVSGARIPSSVSVSGATALDLEIFAIEPTRPLHLTGGILGLRARHPSDPSRWVELRLLGARRVARAVAREAL